MFLKKKLAVDFSFFFRSNQELMMAKLKAARFKQQETYSQMIKEQEEQKKLEKTETQKNSDDGNRGDKETTSLRDFFPLMNSTNSYYRPVRKRPCGPCGGGGCG